jgi:putative DNA primase/helicase
MHDFCRDLSLGAKKRIKSLEKHSFVSSATNFARADKRISASVDQWDENDWMLNTPGGIYDLRTGEHRPARPSDYCMMITGIAPDPFCPITHWLEFLNTISGENQDWIDYMQRASGYFLTGITREHALHFGWGTGTNGKGTMIRVLAAMMGDYHSNASVEMFMSSKVDRHSTELARLRYARLVTCSETHQGRRWDDAKIKALSGGDKITARFMRQDDFEFWPKFKIFISGNHKPKIETPDAAMRRRMNLIPFNITIPDDELDTDLFVKKLEPELPGILDWSIKGARWWYEEGLNPPDIIRASTTEYLSDEDSYAIWLSECTERQDSCSWTNSTALFDNWKMWAERANEYPGSSRLLSQYLKDHAKELGVQYHRRTNGGRGFRGITIKREVAPEFDFIRGHNDTEDLGF